MTQPTQDHAALFSALQDVNAEAAEGLLGFPMSVAAETYAFAALLPVAEYVNLAQARAVLALARGSKNVKPGPVTVHASTEGLRAYRDEDGVTESAWLHSSGELRSYPETDDLE